MRLFISLSGPLEVLIDLLNIIDIKINNLNTNNVIDFIEYIINSNKLYENLTFIEYKIKEDLCV